jgi:hypothetical protein
MPADKPISEVEQNWMAAWQNDELQLSVASAKTLEHDQDGPSRNPEFVG